MQKKVYSFRQPNYRLSDNAEEQHVAGSFKKNKDLRTKIWKIMKLTAFFIVLFFEVHAAGTAPSTLARKPAERLFFHAAISLPPPSDTSHIIHGKVTDEKGEPLIGVSVNEKGTSNGTITDANGHYSINVPAEATLVFSSVGVKLVDVRIGGKTVINVTMQEDVVGLQVINIGYGTKMKADLTGSVSNIGPDKLKDRPITSISAAIEGEAPGVQVQTLSGQPGYTSGVIRIRGVGTMNDTDPMIVIDGIVTDQASMDNLNPSDIESINILKDASEAAIYGSRAANGVILITTKRGKSGSPVISYNAYVGHQTPTTIPQFLDSYQYALLYNEGNANEGLPAKFTADDIAKYKDGSDPIGHPNTNWMGLLYSGSGMVQNHDISVSGGTDQSRYLLSLGYLDQDGVIDNTSANRYNVRFNLNSKISNRINIGLTSALSEQKIIEPGYGGMGFIISETERVPPTYLNKTSDGTWVNYLDGNQIADIHDGGLATTLLPNANGNVFVEIKLMKGLTLKSTVGINYELTDKTTHINQLVYSDGTVQGPNSLTDELTRIMTNTLQSVLTYNTKIQNHNISAMAGVERDSYRFDYDNGYRQNFPSNLLTQLDAGSQTGMTNTGFSDENRLGSYFGRVNYNFKNKYLLQATLRYDGSSKFAPDKRWGLFPSYSAGWRVSQEKFMESITWINDLKLRGSYGSVGNNATGDFQYLSKISFGQDYPFFNTITSGAAQTTSSNSNLTWEKSTSLDFGADMSLFSNKITLTADYYNRLTSNILLALPVSPIYGLPAPTVNSGAMRNSGTEYTLGYSDHIGDFSYKATFYLSYNKNVVVKFPFPAISSYGDYAYETIDKKGYAWNSFYGYQVAGIYQNDQQVQTLPKQVGSPAGVGDYYFKDQNGDGVINGDDRVVLGNEIPNILYGINLNLNYKNFDLSVFGQGVGQYAQKITLQYVAPFYNGGKATKNMLNRWTPQTPNSPFPETHVANQYNWATENNRDVINASYFRLGQLQLGYTIPQSITNRLKIDMCRVYLNGADLFTLTKIYPGIDPEVASSSTAGYDGKYNHVKVVSFGLNLNFK